jgi:hypothetical protein
LFELHRVRFDGLQKQLEDVLAQKVRLHSRLAKLLMEISVVNLAARREVDLPIDEHRYRELQALITRESQEISHAFVEEMKEWICEQERKLNS